jgi:hypothetical protein
MAILVIGREICAKNKSAWQVIVQVFQKVNEMNA